MRSLAQQCLAGAHPIPVPPQRVDLAVVGQVPVGVGQGPRRERVGREPRVHERQPAVEGRVRQVGEELAELVPGEHALVDEGARRQRRHVHAVRPRARRACADRTRAGRAPARPPPIGAGPKPGAPGPAPPRPGPCGAWPGAPRHRDRRARPGRRATPGRPGPPRRRAPPRGVAPWRRRRRRWAGTPAPRRSHPGRGGRSPRARRGTGVGTCTRMPAPSPVATSAPVAPRCARCSSAVSAWRTSPWLRRPWRSATKAMPQASCSKAGSYRGAPGCVGRRPEEAGCSDVVTEVSP